MTSRLLSLFIWLAVAASAVFWGLRGGVRPAAVPGQAVLAGAAAPAAGGDLSRLLGRAPVQAAEPQPLVAAESRLRLIGLVAPRAGGSGGLALISVDGKPPRTYAVGREVEQGLRLLSVSQRQAELGAGGSAPRMTLALPMLAEANRGRLADADGTLPPGQPMQLPNGLPVGAPMMPPGGVQRLPGLPSRPMPAEQADDGQPQQPMPPQPGVPTR